MEYYYIILTNFPFYITVRFNEGNKILIYLNYKNPFNDLELKKYI